MNLRLAVISHQPLSTLGGVPIHIKQLVEALVKIGVDVEVIAPASKSDGFGQSSSYSFHVRPIFLQTKPQTMKTLEFSYRVYKYLLENKRRFDAIHGSQWSMLFPCLKRNEIGLPMITKFHGTFFYGVINTLRYETKYWLFNEAGDALALPVYAYIESTCARKSDGLICISESVKEEVLSLSHYEYGGEVRVIYNGVDIKKFRPLNRNRLRELYGLNEEDRVILYVGLLEPRKGVHHLIKAVRGLLKEHPMLKVLIAGRRERRYTRHLYEIAKPKDRFKFLGKVPHDRLPELYNLAEVCVMPSIYEPLGNVALEAMACEKPVIAGGVGGLREIIRHGKNGFLVTPKAIEKELAKYIPLLLTDERLRKNMGRAARKCVSENFDWMKTATSTMRFIRSVSEGRITR